MTSSRAHECHVSINQAVLASYLAAPASRPALVGALDQGTSSSRFLLVTATGRLLAAAQVEFDQIFPTASPYASGKSCAGWHEHDPFAIWDSLALCVERTVEELANSGVELTASSLKAVGITNQRETVVCWNARTGRPYHHAIVWDDARTAAVADRIVRENPGAARQEEGREAHDALRPATGLPVAAYFAGTRVRWLLDHIPRLREDLASPSERRHVRFGTIDTWLVYMLTGYKRSIAEMEHPERLAHEGGEYKTDVTNASRWLFMDLATLAWDEGLVEAVCGGSGVTVPVATALPRIVPSSDATIGTIRGIPCLEGVVVGAILGDQQAALFGQSCFRPGEAKCTYGTGLFLMMNTGDAPIPSTQGLLTTVAYQLTDPSGAARPPVYALEGSVAFSGSTIGWLRDRLELITDASETEALARSVPSNDNMYLVPAFSGLFAPHWRPDARGCMVGLTASHTKAHIVRAALEASAYQAKEVFDAMVLDSNVQLKEMRVDGGATANKFLMQFQSDVLDAPVVRPECLETTGLGAAFAAGLAVGVWSDLEEVHAMWKADTTWTPSMTVAERDRCWKGWKKAVKRSLNWLEDED